MTRALIFILAALTASTAQAQAVAQGQLADAEPAPFEVVRLGDSDMTCEALVAEIGTLNQSMMAVQQELMAASQGMSQEAMRSAQGQGGRALMTGITGLAAGLVPGAGAVVGVMQAQAQAAAARNRQAAMQDRMQVFNDGAATLGPIAQRLEHLGDIARQRSC